MSRFNPEKLDCIVRETTKQKHIHGTVFHVSFGGDGQSWIGASGNLYADSRYYIASINKLVVSSVVLKLIEKGEISFSNPLCRFLPKETMSGLHIIKGTEYSNGITILHLLSQTSGLPCYLADKPQKGESVLKELVAGIDQPWPVEKVIERVKAMKPHFPPGVGGKAKYIDTNHQLLILVIEQVMRSPIHTVLNQLFADLGMTDTYVCVDPEDTGYAFPYYREKKININRFVSSTGNDIVSTAQDQMRFIKAFFNGSFYPKDKLKSLEDWKPVFFPFQYGIGVQKFHIPRFLSPFTAVPDMIGHCGSTGSVAFHVPEMDVYITGTTNQQASPGAAFQTMIKMIQAL